MAVHGEGGLAAEGSGGEARGIGLGRDTASRAGDDFFGIDEATEKLRSNKQANLRVLSETTGGLLIAAGAAGLGWPRRAVIQR